MKRKIVASALMLLSLCGRANADTVQSLTINGEHVEKIVSQFTFSGDNVVVHFGDTEESYPMDAVVLDFYSSTGIESVSTFKLNGLVDGQLNISGLTEGTPLAVYDTTGKQLTAAKAAGQVNQINVNNLGSGVYILKAGKQIVKFVKR